MTDNGEKATAPELVLSHNDRCKKLALTVEVLSNTELEEMFKMIHDNGCEYSKNNNGIFVNLAWLPIKLLEQLEQYVLFCSKSGSELKKYESLCDVLNKNLQHDKIPLSTNCKKKTNTPEQSQSQSKKVEASVGDDSDTDEKISNKISSSMRFTLLKKKLAKINVQNMMNENELKPDLYIL